MLVKVECYASRTKQRIGYGIYKEGKLVGSEVKGYSFTDFKSAVLESIYRGVMAVRKEVGYEDYLTIVVQNNHVKRWIEERNERRYKNYVEITDKIFDTLEEIKGVYRIVYMPKCKTCAMVENGAETKVDLKLEGVDSLLNM